MLSSESCVKPTCRMHQCESTGLLLWTMFRTHTTRPYLGHVKNADDEDDSTLRRRDTETRHRQTVATHHITRVEK